MEKLVILSEHALARMRERNIGRKQVERTVREPEVERSARHGRKRLSRRFAGRLLTVVVEVREDKVVVVTALWEGEEHDAGNAAT